MQSLWTYIISDILSLVAVLQACSSRIQNAIRFASHLYITIDLLA